MVYIVHWEELWKRYASSWKASQKLAIWSNMAIDQTLNYSYGMCTQVLYSGVLWPHPARVTRLHHRWGANEAGISFQVSEPQDLAV